MRKLAIISCAAICAFRLIAEIGNEESIGRFATAINEDSSIGEMSVTNMLVSSLSVGAIQAIYDMVGERMIIPDQSKGFNIGSDWTQEIVDCLPLPEDRNEMAFINYLSKPYHKRIFDTASTYLKGVHYCNVDPNHDKEYPDYLSPLVASKYTTFSIPAGKYNDSGELANAISVSCVDAYTGNVNLESYTGTDTVEDSHRAFSIVSNWAVSVGAHISLNSSNDELVRHTTINEEQASAKHIFGLDYDSVDKYVPNSAQMGSNLWAVVPYTAARAISLFDSQFAGYIQQFSVATCKVVQTTHKYTMDMSAIENQIRAEAFGTSGYSEATASWTDQVTSTNYTTVKQNPYKADKISRDFVEPDSFHYRVGMNVKWSPSGDWVYAGSESLVSPRLGPYTITRYKRRCSIVSRSFLGVNISRDGGYTQEVVDNKTRFSEEIEGVPSGIFYWVEPLDYDRREYYMRDSTLYGACPSDVSWNVTQYDDGEFEWEDEDEDSFITVINEGYAWSGYADLFASVEAADYLEDEYLSTAPCDVSITFKTFDENDFGNDYWIWKTSVTYGEAPENDYENYSGGGEETEEKTPEDGGPDCNEDGEIVSDGTWDDYEDEDPTEDVPSSGKNGNIWQGGTFDFTIDTPYYDTEFECSFGNASFMTYTKYWLLNW